jgi:hypothetical protein
MNDIFEFKKLIKAIYPSLNVTVSIELAEGENRVAVAEFKAILAGSALHTPVEAVGHSAATVAAALKVPVAKSRREKEARGVLSDCVRRSGGHLDDGQRSAILTELMGCRYHEFEKVAASCRARAVQIGQANLESDHCQLAHS